MPPQTGRPLYCSLSGGTMFTRNSLLRRPLLILARWSLNPLSFRRKDVVTVNQCRGFLIGTRARTILAQIPSWKNRHPHRPVEGIVMHVRTGAPAMCLMKQRKKKQTRHNCHRSASRPLRNHVALITALSSSRSHEREGKKKWHHFLRFSTSVSHLTAIQTDLVRFAALAVEIVSRLLSLCC